MKSCNDCTRFSLRTNGELDASKNAFIEHSFTKFTQRYYVIESDVIIIKFPQYNIRNDPNRFPHYIKVNNVVNVQ